MPEENGATLRPRVELDPKVPGLELRHLAGRSSWYLRYRFNGTQRRPTLGDARVVSRAQARQRALELLAEASAGRDPKAAQRAQESPTIAELWSRYEAEYLPRKKPRSQDEDRTLWRLHAAPRLGNRLVADLTRQDLAALHHAMRASPTRANRTLSLLHKMLKLAAGWGWRDGENPARVDHYPEAPRRRVPRPDEAVRLLTALERWWETEPVFAGLVELLILTGCRLREIMHARRDWIHGNRLYLPDSKTGEKVIVLPAAALAVVERLPRIQGNPYLITGRRSGQPLQSPKKLWAALLRDAEIEGLRIHDLRRFYASMALGAGVTLEAVGQMLGHRQAQTTKVYAYLMEHAKEETAERTATAIAAVRPKP